MKKSKARRPLFDALDRMMLLSTVPVAAGHVPHPPAHVHHESMTPCPMRRGPPTPPPSN